MNEPLIFDKDGHLTGRALTQLFNAEIGKEDMLTALSHMASCERCAENYALIISSADLLPVPAGFAEEIKKKKEKTGKDRESGEAGGSGSFGLYVLRVTVAAAAALAITFSPALNSMANGKSSVGPPPDFKAFDSISAGLNSFSQNLLNLGVSLYDFKKK